jgi:hypothetical protein
MRLIGLAVVLALGLAIGPLAAEAQETGTPHLDRGADRVGRRRRSGVVRDGHHHSTDDTDEDPSPALATAHDTEDRSGALSSNANEFIQSRRRPCTPSSDGTVILSYSRS